MQCFSKASAGTIKHIIISFLSSRNARHAILIIILSCLSYYNILFNGFTNDDHFLIEKNPNIGSLKGVYLIAFEQINKDNIQDSNQAAIRAWMYRPSSFFIFYLIGKLFSVTPVAFHLFNIIFHCLNGILLYILCLRLYLTARAALFTAIIFAVHPVHTDVVASAITMSEELIVFFGILSFLFLISTIKGKYFIASILFLAALLAKENAVMLIAVYFGLFAYLHVQGNSKPWKGKELHVAAAICVPLIIYFAMRYHVTGAFFRHPQLQQSLIDNPLLQAGFAERILTSIYLLGKYLALFFYPVNLSADYALASIAPVTSAADPGFIISLLSLLVILIIFIFLFIKKRRLEALGIFIFFVGLLPVSNLLFTGATMMAERYLYLPSIGLCMVIGNSLAGFTESQKKTNRVAVYAIVAVLIAVMSGLCIARNKDWKDDLTLFSRVLQVYPNNLKALHNLSSIYYNRQDYELAIPILDKIIQKYPDYYNARLHIIIAYSQTHKINDAINHCENALRLFPNREDLYGLMADLYKETGNKAKALFTLKEGINRIPDSYFLYYRIGLYYFNENNCESAKEYFNNSIRISDTPDPHYYLARCYYNQGKGREALLEFEKSYSIRKVYPDILKYFILLSIDFRRYAQAEQAAADYIRMFPDNAEAYAVTAKLYWQASQDYNFASHYLKKAYSLDSSLCKKFEYMSLCRIFGLQ